MTKTPKNGSASSTPTPGGAGGGGNPGSVGPGAPPSVGSTKSEPTGEAGNLGDSTASHDQTPGGRSGTPHSLPENNANSSGNKDGSGDPSEAVANATSTLNGGSTSTDGLLCDNGLETAGSASAGGGGSNSARGTPDNSNEGGPGSVGGAQIKSEDVKPSVSNCSTPLQSTNNPLPSDMDLLDGFDSKDGGKRSISTM